MITEIKAGSGFFGAFMKRFLGLILVVLCFAGCTSNPDVTAHLCRTETEDSVISHEIEYTEDGTNLLSVKETIVYDAELDEGRSVEELVMEIVRTSPYYNETVNGVSYEMTSVGTKITMIRTVDLTKIARPVLKGLNLLDENIIRGDDSGFVVRAADYRSYIENTEGMHASCDLNP